LFFSFYFEMNEREERDFTLWRYTINKGDHEKKDLDLRP